MEEPASPAAKTDPEPSPSPAQVEPLGAAEPAHPDMTMTAGAREVAELTGIFPLYQRLLIEQQKATSSVPSDTNEDIRRNQRIIYLHGRITQSLQTIDCELRRALGRIDSDAADLNDLKALLSDERAKVQHRTSLVNLVSGGATRIGGYTTGLATPNTLPINVLEIFDGVVQIGLSSLMVRQEHREKRSSQLTPETITSFLSMRETPQSFPKIVWAYLNHPLPGRKDGKSRRQVVIDNWIGMGRVTESNSRLSSTGVLPGPAIKPDRSTESSLDVTLAMMSDIKATLSSLEASLAELSETLRLSYANDPEF
jgi:hypothetical protein